ESYRPGDESSVELVSRPCLPDLDSDDQLCPRACRFRPDGRRYFFADPRRPEARGHERASGESRSQDESAGRALAGAGLSLWQRDAMGFDRAGRGVRVDKIFWL